MQRCSIFSQKIDALNICEKKNLKTYACVLQGLSKLCQWKRCYKVDYYVVDLTKPVCLFIRISCQLGNAINYVSYNIVSYVGHNNCIVINIKYKYASILCDKENPCMYLDLY
jgi:hypothetical protein